MPLFLFLGCRRSFTFTDAALTLSFPPTAFFAADDHEHHAAAHDDDADFGEYDEDVPRCDQLGCLREKKQTVWLWQPYCNTAIKFKLGFL